MISLEDFGLLLADHFGYGLVTALSMWIGIVSFANGLKRFGKPIKIPLVKLFLALVGVLTLLGFIIGRNHMKHISHLALVITILGVLIWLISLSYRAVKKLTTSTPTA